MDLISSQLGVLVKELVIVENKALVTLWATKPGIDLYDALTSAYITISGWQERELKEV